MSDFDNILDRAGSEVSDEQVLYPNGTYILRCAGVAFNSFTNDSGQEIPTASLGFAVGAPQEDVDQDEYAEAAELVQGQRVWKRFTLDNSKNIADFKRAIRAFGIDPNDGAEYPTLRDAAKACKGQEVLGYIGTKTYKTRAGDLVKDNEVKSLTSVASLDNAA